MWEKTVHVQPPYNFDRVLDRLSINPLIKLNKDERSVKVPFYFENEPVVVTVKAAGTTDDPSFVVTGSHKDSMEYALQRVSHIFQWDVSLGKSKTIFYKQTFEIFSQSIVERH